MLFYVYVLLLYQQHQVGAWVRTHTLKSATTPPFALALVCVFAKLILCACVLSVCVHNALKIDMQTQCVKSCSCPTGNEGERGEGGRRVRARWL